MRKTGIFSWYGFYNEFQQRIENIKAAGFDGLMLWWEDEEGQWPISRHDMPGRVKEAGLEIFNIHMAGSEDNLMWCDDEKLRRKHVEPIKRTIEEIADYDIHNLVVHLCERGDVPAPNKNLLKSVEELIPVAEANHTVLSLENTWRSDYLEAVWQEFPVKELGFCFDTSHANLRDQFYLAEKYHHLLSAYHLSDNDGIQDRHWLPFDGVIDFTKVMPLLRKKEIPYTLEVIANKQLYPEETQFLAAAYEKLNHLIDLPYE